MKGIKFMKYNEIETQVEDLKDKKYTIINAVRIREGLAPIDHKKSVTGVSSCGEMEPETFKDKYGVDANSEDQIFVEQCETKVNNLYEQQEKIEGEMRFEVNKTISKINSKYGTNFNHNFNHIKIIEQKHVIVKMIAITLMMMNLLLSFCK